MNKDFLWGGSTSSFQFEGAYNEDGRELSTTDTRKVPIGIADTKVASDHYHHYIEDVELMKELGIKVYRFSFSWSRIIKNDGTVNEQGIQFYNNLIDLCIKNEIVPFPTLYHFEMPQILVDTYGGWKSRKCIDDFRKYAHTCFEVFGDRIKMWGTINEQLIVSASGDLNGNQETDFIKRMKNMYTISYHMSVAEKYVIQDFHKMIPDGKIGPVCSMQVVYPETSSSKDAVAGEYAQDFLQNMFLDMSVFGDYPQSVKNYLQALGLNYPLAEDKAVLVSNKPDIIGVNYYATTCIRARKEGEDYSKMPPFYQNELFTLGNNAYVEKTKWMEFGVDPEGLYVGIRRMYERYKLPMIICENGLAMSDELIDGKVHDADRIEYLNTHIAQCKRLVDERYPLFGYCVWSLFDLVSSHQGFAKRYGLIYVNRDDHDIKDCVRIPKDSYDWYKNVIKNNGNIKENNNE